MKHTIAMPGSEPAYLQLYKQLRDAIVQGLYPYGSKLPSKRVLADQSGVSTITVEHSYALLCEEGYLEARERSGYFVIFRTDDGFLGTPAASEPTAPANTVPHPAHSPMVNTPASSNTPEFPLSVLTRTMRSVITEYGDRILERSPGVGRPELREAIRQYLARSRGITAAADQIILGSGSEYLYSLIVELLGRDRTYAIESPSYKKIQQVYQAAEVPVEMLPLGHDGIESTALWATQADVLHISPYRSFPSGVTASASKRHEYLRWAAMNDRYIIEDDFESEFSISRKPEETLFSHTTRDHVIYMNTFSKTISPSLRIGYMVLPQHLAAAFQQKLGFYACTVPTYMQFVLTELLNNGDFERHINRVRRQKRKEMGKPGR